MPSNSRSAVGVGTSNDDVAAPPLLPLINDLPHAARHGAVRLAREVLQRGQQVGQAMSAQRKEQRPGSPTFCINHAGQLLVIVHPHHQQACLHGLTRMDVHCALTSSSKVTSKPRSGGWNRRTSGAQMLSAAIAAACVGRRGAGLFARQVTRNPLKGPHGFGTSMNGRESKETMESSASARSEACRLQQSTIPSPLIVEAQQPPPHSQGTKLTWMSSLVAIRRASSRE